MATTPPTKINPAFDLSAFPADPLFRRIRAHAEQRMELASDLPREERFPAYKRFIGLETDMLRRYHEKGDGGFRVTRARAIVLDVFFEYLLADALASFEKKEGQPPCRMALVATGGYGRGELSPHSDIDLMMLYPNRSDSQDMERMEAVLSEEILYPLWDLRFKVGHSTRTIQNALDEADREIKSKNAFLDARFLGGSVQVFRDFKKQYARYLRKRSVSEYIEQRLADKRARHANQSGTVFVQEPDIKNGVGGLRDFHSVLWLAHLSQGINGLYQLAKSEYMNETEARDLFNAYDFLLRVRNQVHFLHKRPTDSLALEEQPEVALKLGYKNKDIFKRVERFMKDYYSHARNIHHISGMMEQRLIQAENKRNGKHDRVTFLAAIRARRYDPGREIDGFLCEDKILYAISKNVFEEEPVRLIRIFRYSQQRGAEIDFGLANLIEQSLPLIDSRFLRNPEANRAFRAILQTAGEVYPILLKMHELGILGRFIPEFGKLTCLVQYEYYHRYTADIHVLNTIKELDRIFSRESPAHAHYHEALRDLRAPTLLYLTLLLHDIGKAYGVKGHATSGARAAEPLLERLGIDAKLREEILFIIRHHLEMARFWQKYDLDEPATIRSFAKLVGDTRKLKNLYVHTYCDARGTAESLWNSYKDSLHTALYERTLAELSAEESGTPDPQEQKSMVHKDIMKRQIPELSEEEVEAHFSLLPDRYFVHHSNDEVELHLRMIHRLLTQINEADSVGSLVPIIDWEDDLNQSLTTVNVVTWDRAGLFYKLAGAFSAVGLNILSTKAISRSDHITIDTFYVVESSGGFVRDKRTRERFEEVIREALTREQDLLPLIEAQAAKLRKRSPGGERYLEAPFPGKVSLYHELSLGRTIIEVQAQDDLGLLYQLTKAIFDNGFDITFARIVTERGLAMDTFYIENIQSSEGSNTALLDLREELSQIVQPSRGQQAVAREAG